MYFFITITTAIALSLDAFSLAIIYGTIINKKNLCILISIIVGIFHFFMPLIGYFTSNLLIINFIPNTSIISFLIFLFLGIEMITSKNDETNLMNLYKLPSVLLFAFTVSLDSFSVGIAISSRKEIITIPIIMFSTVSFFFTYTGLTIGKKINNVLGKYTNKIGGFILILLSIHYLLT